MPRGKPSIPTLTEHGATLLREYVETDNKRTEILRSLAKVVVGIRAQFQGANGRPDWNGATGPYRECIASMYEAAGIPPDSQGSVQAALRYHVGNIVREVAPSDDLAALHLTEAGPRQRAAERTSRPATGEHATDMIRDAIANVMHAATVPEKDADARAEVVMLLLTLEHQCQTLRALLVPEADEVLTVEGILSAQAA